VGRSDARFRPLGHSPRSSQPTPRLGALRGLACNLMRSPLAARGGLAGRARMLVRHYVTRSEHHVLETRFPPEECAARLRSRIRARRDVARWGPAPTDGRVLTGWVTKDRFSVRLRERWFQHNTNPNRPTATGRFVQGSSGTRIELRLGLDLGVVQILRFSSGVAGTIFFLIAVSALVRTAIEHGHLSWVVIAASAFLLWQALGWWSGRRRTLEARERLLGVLNETLDARIVSSD
jgi:hypothetical protein